MVQGMIMEVDRIMVIGKRRTICTSEMRHMTAMREKRIENGMRVCDLGSNSHSKEGEGIFFLVNYFLKQ